MGSYFCLPLLMQWADWCCTSPTLCHPLGCFIPLHALVLVVSETDVRLYEWEFTDLDNSMGKQNKPENSCRLIYFIYFVIQVFYFFLLFLKVVKNNYMTIIINWRKDISGTKFIQADCGDRRIYPSIVFPAWKLRKSRIIWAEENSYLRASRFSCVCTQRRKTKQNKKTMKTPLQLFLDPLSMSSKQDDAFIWFSSNFSVYIFFLTSICTNKLDICPAPK